MTLISLQTFLHFLFPFSSSRFGLQPFSPSLIFFYLLLFHNFFYSQLHFCSFPPFVISFIDLLFLFCSSHFSFLPNFLTPSTSSLPVFIRHVVIDVFLCHTENSRRNKENNLWNDFVVPSFDIYAIFIQTGPTGHLIEGEWVRAVIIK